MKNKFTTCIIGLVVISIIAITAVFGIIIFDEVNTYMQTDAEDFTYSGDTSKIVENTIKTPDVIQNNPLNTIQSSGSTSMNTNNSYDYSHVKVNKYFYNQLDNYSKIMYQAFESNKENMKSGTYKIDLGTAFSSLLSQENGSDLLGEYYQSAIEAYTYDNPDVFYLSPNKMYLNIETTSRGGKSTYTVFISNGEQANYLTDEFSSKAQVDEAIAQVEQVRSQIIQKTTGNALQDIKMIHDYLVDTITYDSSLSKPYIYNIYGAMVQKMSVCEGYARSMKYLLDSIGIESTLVIGQGTNSEGKTENHAWNYVKLNEQWYAIDATWDDPVIIGGGRVPESYKYKYFLKGSIDMNQDHTPSGQFTPNGKTFIYPTLSISNYQ